MADLVALLMLTLAGLIKPGVNDAQLEKKLAAVVQQDQPAPLEKVAVDASKASSEGVESVDFHFTNLFMEPLMVRDSHFVVSGISRAADDKLSLKDIEWRAELDEDALTAALNSQKNKLSDAKVSLTPDGITLSGKYKVLLGQKMGFSVTGNLFIEEGSLLVFHIDKSKAAGMNIPKGLNKTIEDEVNPVYDLAKFAARSKKDIDFAKQQLDYDFKLEVTRISPKSGYLEVGGSA
jgi:hypothetical protein